MNKKNEKGPGLVGIVIAGLLMAGFGAFAGVIFLASYPIQGFASQDELDRYLEKEELPFIQPGEVYYIKGPERSSVTWQQIRKDILDGRKEVIDLPAGAINNWLSANFEIGRLDDSESGIVVLPGMPKLSSLATGEVFLSMPMEFQVYGTSYKRTYVAIGRFEGEGSPRFVVDKIQLDCADIPVPIIGEMLHERLLSIFSRTDEFELLASALAEVSAVEVGDNRFRLQL